MKVINHPFIHCLIRIRIMLMTSVMCVCVVLCVFCFQHRVTAYGAAGGRSVLAMSRSHGVYITGDFLLRRGELLHILVGQKGEDACPNVSLPSRSRYDVW